MCDMERFFNDLKEGILNFKLDLCCFVFSVRAGILLCGYFNVISSMICLIAVATEALPPLMANAQQSFMDGDYIKSTCAFAYSADLCLAVLLLCGMYRKDITLLTYYTYCGLAMAASTLLVYSMVIGVLSVLHTLLLVVSLTYQIYLILLVRSVMVDLKHEAEKKTNNYPVYCKLNDIEASAAADPVERYVVDTVDNKKIAETISVQEDLTKPLESELVEDNANSPTTSEPAKVDTKQAEEAKGLRYPYKFIAIKIPKQDTIKEEKENEDTEKETDREAVIKEEPTEVTKDAKKRKRSIFGRKLKNKSDDDKTKDDTKKN